MPRKERPQHLRIATGPAPEPTEPKVVQGPYRQRENDPTKAVRLTVRGPRHQEMLDHALDIAAQFLGEPRRFLYVSDAGTATVHRRERFVAHLGIEPKPVEWELGCTVRLDSEIVELRKKGPKPDEGCADPEEDDDED